MDAAEEKRKRQQIAGDELSYSPIGSLDEGCLMHIFSILEPIPDRYNTALVCHRWRYLACHSRLWLRVERTTKKLAEPGVYSDLETAVSAARPGDTILIAAGGSHAACNIQIKKPLCLVGGGKLPDETVLVCARGSDRKMLFVDQCTGVSVDMQSCKSDSEGGAWLLFSSSARQTHCRRLHTAV